eukprot:m.159996 g.159996  ORF g.159996 m.159996 type:complete len:753 (-) comp14345_c0_seq2:198-2456(-)
MSGFSLEGSSVGAAPNSLSRPSRVPPMPAGQRSQGQRAYLSGSMLEMLAQQVQDRSQGRAAQHGIAQGHHAGVREQGHLAGGIVGAGWGDGSISGSKVQGSTSGRTQRIARSADPSRRAKQYSERRPSSGVDALSRSSSNASFTVASQTTSSKSHVTLSSKPQVISRTEHEQSLSPERLNLDNRGFLVCPVIKHEPHLQLLNLQHNMISRISHLENLRTLIFLDLYNNDIESITGLSNLTSLRVLMLGRNRISHIENLHRLTTLDVLDLHGNSISTITGLDTLSSLRVLNLASNYISNTSGLSSLRSLVELNLRRNQISRFPNARQSHPMLQRLFLSHNNIESSQDLGDIINHGMLLELCLDGNPLSELPMYREEWIGTAPELRTFDGKRVTDEEKRMAAFNYKKYKEKAEQEDLERRLAQLKSEAVDAARASWIEYMAQCDEKWKIDPDAELEEEHQDVKVQSITSPVKSSRFQLPSEAEEGFSMVTDNSVYVCGSTEHFFSQSFPPTVTSLSLQYIEVNTVLPHLERVRRRFPQLHRLELHQVNLRTATQLNAFAASLPTLSHVVLSETEPFVTRFTLWRLYTIHRFGSGLMKVNDTAVGALERSAAEQCFAPVTSHLHKIPPLLVLASESRIPAHVSQLPRVERVASAVASHLKAHHRTLQRRTSSNSLSLRNTRSSPSVVSQVPPSSTSPTPAAQSTSVAVQISALQKRIRGQVQKVEASVIQQQRLIAAFERQWTQQLKHVHLNPHA